ncbi:hypothetical protein [Komagataeibacter nataicola]|nr:hypothetical protein [Komagataeibacter nataicola]
MIEQDKSFRGLLFFQKGSVLLRLFEKSFTKNVFAGGHDVLGADFSNRA